MILFLQLHYVARRKILRTLLIVCVLLCSACASYVTPGGSVHLNDINRSDIAEVASRKPSPNFPARLAIARVQAPNYRSYSSEGYGTGRFSVVTTQDLITEEQFQSFGKWPAIAGVAPINRLLLPSNFESLDDLRLSAAKVQADVLMVYTIDTSFRVQGRAYGPLSAISLGLAPDRDAYITSTASAIFTDVRTGFVYGVAEATAKATGLSNFWSSSDTVDKKRIEAEQQAFLLLINEAAKTWSGIAAQYSK
jgi:hypothetical protein